MPAPDMQGDQTLGITDEDIAKQREVVGLYEPNRTQEFHATLSGDAIRNFALGVGDDNPLYTDEDYAKSTRWGGIIAPSIMMAVTNRPLLGDRIEKEKRDLVRGLFKGCQIFMSGGTWTWYRPIYPGDTVFSYEGEESVEEKPSEFGGRTVHIVRRYVKFNQRGEVIGVYRALRIIAERSGARKKGKYTAIEPAHYSKEEVKAIDAAYLREAPRGNAPRYWEDVSEGDELGSLQKGPLTMTEIIMAHCAGYGFAPYRMLAASRIAAKDRQVMRGMYSRNDQGVYDTEARVHWDRELAKKVGNPEAYDWGLQREFWLHHALTDWAGDAGFVLRQRDEVRKFNYMGDLQKLSGKVTRRYEENEQMLVDVEVVAQNQRGDKTAFADATIALPSKKGRPVVLPAPPAEMQATAFAMLAEHNRRKYGN
ncbi:MAG: MaoC family dehydratase N-terminal domain-containing protein [Pseudomonadota bacterium]|nr:MaoC family dehydratase N-terminal domain-containing protein [Pseudomonadota bacterium]